MEPVEQEFKPPHHDGISAVLLKETVRLPQVEEIQTPQPLDVAGEFALYDEIRILFTRSQCRYEKGV